MFWFLGEYMDILCSIKYSIVLCNILYVWGTIYNILFKNQNSGCLWGGKEKKEIRDKYIGQQSIMFNSSSWLVVS